MHTDYQDTAGYPNISELCSHLNALLRFIDECDRWGNHHNKIATQQHYDNLTNNLPTFGGSQPADTRGIYSWSADQILIRTNKWTVINRELD